MRLGSDQRDVSGIALPAGLHGKACPGLSGADNGQMFPRSACAHRRSFRLSADGFAALTANPLQDHKLSGWRT
jgi:hypothetical protein